MDVRVKMVVNVPWHRLIEDNLPDAEKRKDAMNTWPGGHRHAMSQSDHEAWNRRNYPGTRQLCFVCEAPTGRCEDDSLFGSADVDRLSPLCVECWTIAEREGE